MYGILEYCFEPVVLGYVILGVTLLGIFSILYISSKTLLDYDRPLANVSRLNWANSELSTRGLDCTSQLN